MKTIIVSFYNAFPPESGAATVTYNIAKYLYGEKYLIQLNHTSDNGHEKIDKNINLININLSSYNRLKKAVKLLTHFPRITNEIKKIAPDFIIFEGASWTLYNLALVFMLKASKIGSKIIYHSHNVEYLLRRQKNNMIIALITKWTEGKVLKRVNLFTAVSKEDASSFKFLYGAKPSILPNGVDVERFDLLNNVQTRKIRAKYNLSGKLVLFMGMVEFLPNKEGIDFLINDVFPIVVKDYPDSRLAILGGNVEFKREWLINPGVIPFEEVPSFVKTCDVCVAPIFSGSGTRLKILEYMAAGKPVVSTTKGAEGISVINGENIVIANDSKHFADAIVSLLKNPEYLKKIGNEGKKMVRKNYSWKKIIKKFNEELCLLQI